MAAVGAESLFAPLKQGLVSNQVVEHITERILDGRLVPGAFLPTENALCQQLNVGRSTVREAMRVLEARGLVQSRHGIGVAVADRSHEATVDTLSLLLQRNKGSLRELLEVRLGLETQAAALAARRASAADLAAMRAAINAMQRESSTVDEYVQADLLFHLHLARAAHNRVLVVLLEAVKDLLLVSIHATYQLDGHTARRLADHTRILDAVAQQDPLAAEQAMAAHLESTEAMLRQLGLLQQAEVAVVSAGPER
jgi:GntR family transcriptional repressor for pyruvate dehydrogenase complex